MLYLISKKNNYGSYGFRFQDDSRNETANIWSIGWQRQTSASYDWDGLNRSDVGTYVFQYTISGSGRLDIGEKSYPLRAGKTFLVEVPSCHRYYFSGESDHWEFVYITLVGSQATECWEYIQANGGPVLSIPPEAKLVQLLLKIYQEVCEKRVTDLYCSSAKAYEFVMECYRFMKNIDNPSKQVPERISEAVCFIQAHYKETISLGDIANAAGLSRYYLINLFREYLNTTPLQYITKLRIEKAMDLLTQTNLSVNDIALAIGYANANYFNKVFKKLIGTSPGQFRECKNSLPTTHILIE
ncbi:AraC family transcriptional regulator [Brevibacillus brevis]|uniref:AraC family transcriptional regulator n=1 Tax=Brevibacillus brevis TaxID=1393 RepID=UPI001F374072|nr:AraC family transcriptional regulator [Brevibacillus brevis]UIO45169.1 AraC family transcriptional regulator [Brevibacillus brevis]